MADIAQAMRYKIDVKNGLVKQPMTGVLMRGDKNANRIIAELVDGDKIVSLDGVTVTGKFFRGGDGIEIPLEGSASGNEATVLLNEHCYAVDGYFEASIKLKTGGATRTILTVTGHVESDGDGGILDVEHVIPSVDDIVAQYQRMQEVTQQTESAGNAAAASAQTAIASAGKANTAATNANNAASAANTAASGASGWANATMTATALASGSTPTATVTTASDGHKVITLGIPRGNTGATPQISVQVATGAAGSEASVSVSGTAENPVIHLTIPRGETGAIENLTINGKPVESGTITIGIDDISGLSNAIANAGGVKTVAGVSPDSAGNVALTAASVGALASGGTAADSSKLGGKTWAERLLDIYPIGSIYMSVNSTSPASLFGGTWEQLQDRFLLAAGSTYSAGSTGGEATHTLTENEMPTHEHKGITIAGNKLTCWSDSGSGGVFDMSSLFNGSGNNINDFLAEPVGGGAAHNNMPPYLAVYMWKRVS